MNADLVLAIVREVLSLSGPHNAYGLSPYWNGFEQACEEVIARIEQEPRE